MLQQDIHISPKKVRNNLIAYLMLVLFFCWGFWYGTGKFFTENYYYPSMVFLMPVCVVFMLAAMVKEVRFFSKTGPFISLSDEGVRFFGSYFNDIGFVKWSDVERCSDIAVNGMISERYVLVYARNAELYSSRISDARQRLKYHKLAPKRGNALMWMEARRLDCDLTELKRTIYQRIEACKTNH